MSPLEQKAFDMFAFLPKQKQKLIYELIINLLPEDVATPDDLSAIAQAKTEYANGEAVKLEDIDWN